MKIKIIQIILIPIVYCFQMLKVSYKLDFFYNCVCFKIFNNYVLLTAKKKSPLKYFQNKTEDNKINNNRSPTQSYLPLKS